jgi:hypothetical protein
VWTVRLATLEARASYLDLALAELLGNALEAHRAAAKLLNAVEEVAGRQDFAHTHVASVQSRERRPRPRGELGRRKPLALMLRALALAVVVSMAFMLTTWLTTLR